MRKQPTQLRSQEMVERIVDAAGRVLQEQGIAGFGTRQVAEKAGISVGSLYQYYANKQQLLQALQEQLTDRMMRMFKALVPQLTGYSVYASVRVILRGACQVLDENDGRYLALVRQWERSDMHQSINRIESMVFTTVGVLASAHPDLRRMRQLPLALYMLINSAIFNLVRYSSEPSEYFTREQLIDGIAQMFSAYVTSQLQPDMDTRVGR